MRTERLPADTWALRFSAYCGMSYDIVTGETLPGARSALADLLRRRRRTGHAIAVIEPGQHFECQEPEGSALVPDNAGTVRLVQETVKAVRCHQCDGTYILDSLR